MSRETRPRPEDLPPLHEGELDAEGLRAFERDLRACAEVGEIRIRSGRGARAATACPTLEDAMTALRNGTAAAVQIRYRHGPATWLDTVMRAEGTFRIIRVRVV